jgi:hypothetical protein
VERQELYQSSRLKKKSLKEDKLNLDEYLNKLDDLKEQQSRLVSPSELRKNSIGSDSLKHRSRKDDFHSLESIKTDGEMNIY